MAKLGLETTVVDERAYQGSVERFREAGILLPTFAQLADPTTIPPAVDRALAAIEPDAPDPLNLFRVHWYNGADRRRRASLPEVVVLPSEITGVEAKIVLVLGDRFPMIAAHKVLAAYGCLAPRVVTGQFDPQVHKACWPSTGNYCRGGVAISRIMGCRGVAVLPEGMSRQRFNWLERWVADPADVIRTPGTESNVKEIYDKCAELDCDPSIVIFNQFCEFGNHLVHYLCTGRALEHAFEALVAERPGLRLAAFVSATGSAGTIAAGDYLKDRFGSRIVAAEALECPTLLYNGFGEHNIQGIGDKHVPLIHNVLNTDFVVGISQRATDRLDVLCNSEAGQRFLRERRGVSAEVVERLPALGLSSLCNLLGAIKTAKYLGLRSDDVVITVATDGADMYSEERPGAIARYFNGRFDEVDAAEVFGEHLLGCATDHLLELGQRERERVFNLGYYTWVEQQGISFAEFNQRRVQGFWRGLRDLVPIWDGLIEAFNEQTGVTV